MTPSTTFFTSGRWFRLLAVLSALTLLFAACETDDEGDADGTASPGGASPTATAPAGGETETPTPTPTGDTQGSDQPGQAQVEEIYQLAPGGSPTPGATEPAAGGDAVQHALQANIGAEAPQDLVEDWDIDILPDGTGLPEGEGTVSMGADVYANSCARCHGDDGLGTDLAPQLVLEDGEPGPWEYGEPQTVANYWPYLTTYMDYIRRAMPFDNPDTLTSDELYAVTAWILNQNGMLEDDATLDADRVMEINELPNLESFFPCYPDECRPEPELRGGGQDGGGGGQ